MSRITIHLTVTSAGLVARAGSAGVRLRGTTNVFMNAVNTIVAGALGALISAAAGAGPALIVVVGSLTGLTYLAVMIDMARRSFAGPPTQPRFPTPASSRRASPTERDTRIGRTESGNLTAGAADIVWRVFVVDGLGSDDHQSAAETRDATATSRDLTAGERDAAGDERDRVGAERDADADRRDAEHEASDADVRTRAGGSDAVVEDILNRWAQERREASDDRSCAARDRVSGAGDRLGAARDRRAGGTDREASSVDRHDASFDHLTGTYERRAGFAELNREIARARRLRESLVVAFFDVDGLKEINDQRGHSAGDRVLAEFASTVRRHLRPYDLVMRYGGDEFVCVLSGISVDDATARLAPLEDALSGAPEHSSVSVGIAELLDGDTAEDVIARADEALYLTRRQGRPQ